MQAIFGIISTVAIIGFLAVGLVQCFAIVDGVGHWLGITGILAWIVAGFLAYFPLVGSVLGYLGATEVWHWPAWQALALFFWWVPLVVVYGALGMFSEEQ